MSSTRYFFHAFLLCVCYQILCPHPSLVSSQFLFLHCALSLLLSFLLLFLCTGEALLHMYLLHLTFISRILPEMVTSILSDSFRKERVLSQRDASDVLRDAFLQTEACINHHYEVFTLSLLYISFAHAFYLHFYTSPLSSDFFICFVELYPITNKAEHSFFVPCSQFVLFFQLIFGLLSSSCNDIEDYFY